MFDMFDIAIAKLVEELYIPLEQLRIIDAVQESKRDLLEEAITECNWETVYGKEVR